MELIPHRLTPVEHLTGICSLSGIGTVLPALTQPEPYLRQIPTRLPLKAFRGVRAISGFG